MRLMTVHELAAPWPSLCSSWFTRVMRAFQRADPRPRAQVFIVDVEGAAVFHPADSVQVSPRDDGVACGISCAAGAEVDDSGELSAAGEKVVGGDVAVKSVRVRCLPC